MNRSLTVGGTLHYFLGVSLFCPSLSLFTLGNQTGIQAALVMLFFCGIARLMAGKVRQDRPLIYLLLAWGLTLGTSVYLAGIKPEQRNAMVVFGVSLSIIFIFGVIDCHHLDYNDRLQNGIISGAIISAVYALYQQLAFRIGLPYGIPPMNNPSFSLIRDSGDVGLRSFGFFPEPSMLAAYLIPITVSLLFVGSIKTFKETYWINGVATIIMFGVVASGSFSIIVALPMVLLLCLVARRATVSALLKLAGATIIVGFLLLFISKISDWAANLISDLSIRLAGAMDDPSLIVRYGMKVASFNIFLDHPVFGCGIVASADYFYSSMPPESIGIQDEISLTGGDSLPMYILSGQGIVGFAMFLGVLILAYRRSRTNPFLSYALLGCLVVMTLQAGNVDLYLIWVIIGLCIGQKCEAPSSATVAPNSSGSFPARVQSSHLSV
jgi:hypothetical protein